MVVLEDLVVGYAAPRGAVLHPATTKVESGQLVCVIGRNGAGKSTLMRTISGLQAPLSGASTLDGEPVSGMAAVDRARRIAVVVTDRVQSPGLKVDDVVALGRHPHTRWQGHLTSDDTARIGQALDRAGATPFRGRHLDSLSDGERQRVMIARALAQEPRLMVLDEITAFLDLPGRVEIMSLLRRQARDTGTLVLLSTHDLDLALALSDQLWLVDDGRLLTGTATDHIESGAIGRAFDTAEVRFDSLRRAFLTSDLIASEHSRLPSS